MTDSDVDVILQSYFATIAEKDSDALKLFEDNKRMRALVEQTLHAREELASRYHTTQLLVTSLQTALDEKERWIAAHEHENDVWRNAIAELRVLLDRPSELDAGPEDVVDDIRDMSSELHSLRQGLQYAQWCCRGWESYTLECVMEAEEQERRLLEEEATELGAVLQEYKRHVMHMQRGSDMQESLATTAVAQWETSYALLHQERDEAAEQQARVLHRLESDARKLTRQVEELQRARAELAEQVAVQKHDLHTTRQRHSVEQEAAWQRSRLVSERCSAAEDSWMSCVTQLRSLAHRLAATSGQRDDLLAKHEAAVLSHEQSRRRVSKLLIQVERYKKQQSEFNDLQAQYTAQQEDLRGLREKYLAASEKERSVRQQLHTSGEAAQARVHAAEDAATAAQQLNTVLEERLHVAQDDTKAAQQEVESLRRQVKDHRGTAAMLHAAQEQLRETERHAFNFQSALESLTEEHREETKTSETRHEAEVVALHNAHREELAQRTLETQRRVEELETKWQHAEEAHAHEKERWQAELHEWIGEVDKLKKEVAAAQDRCDAEKSARQLLEAQQNQETTLVQHMMEQSLEEARRGSQLAQLRSEMESVMRRNELVEEACRRSAAVIAQLREALHREQMTSRTLRLRETSASR